MTREEIMSLEAGKEIDELVAEKVMGWHKVPSPYGEHDDWIDADGRYQHPVLDDYSAFEDEEDFHTIHWHPSQSILWAWDVVERLRSDALSLGWEKRDFQLMQEDRLEGGLWVVQTEKPSSRNADEVYVTAETAPLAICRAALLAMEET